MAKKKFAQGAVTQRNRNSKTAEPVSELPPSDPSIAKALHIASLKRLLDTGLDLSDDKMEQYPHYKNFRAAFHTTSEQDEDLVAKTYRNLLSMIGSKIIAGKDTAVVNADGTPFEGVKLVQSAIGTGDRHGDDIHEDSNGKARHYCLSLSGDVYMRLCASVNITSPRNLTNAEEARWPEIKKQYAPKKASSHSRT